MGTISGTNYMHRGRLCTSFTNLHFSWKWANWLQHVCIDHGKINGGGIYLIHLFMMHTEYSTHSEQLSVHVNAYIHTAYAMWAIYATPRTCLVSLFSHDTRALPCLPMFGTSIIRMVIPRQSYWATVISLTYEVTPEYVAWQNRM